MKHDVRNLLWLASFFAIQNVACSQPTRANSTQQKSLLAQTSHSTSVLFSPSQQEKYAQVHIPAGKVLIGSLPGEEGRDPTLEPILSELALPEFWIDEFPYPGGPPSTPLTGVSMSEAARLCSTRGQRLCSELEWERACRGPENNLFSTGKNWNQDCTQNPLSCASNFGVHAMGTSLREWTASTVLDPKLLIKNQKRSLAILKGATTSSPASSHRCAARVAVEASRAKTILNIGFRCCSGPSLTSLPTIPDPTLYPTFEKVTLASYKLRELVEQEPELEQAQSHPKLFHATDVQKVLNKGKVSSSDWTLTTEPILWSPEVGTRILVFAGRAETGSFIVAFHKINNDQYRLASSFVFAHEHEPIVLGYQPTIKREILWSTCWNCPGEGGAITYRDDHRVVIVQR